MGPQTLEAIARAHMASEGLEPPCFIPILTAASFSGAWPPWPTTALVALFAMSEPP
jgi:hypothetical protein